MSKNRSLNAAKRAQVGQKKKSKQAAQQQLAASLGITAPLRPVVKALPKTSLRELLAQAKATLHEVLSSASLAAQPAPLRVFFSFSAGAERAQVVHFSARDTEHLDQQLNTWQQRSFKKSPPVRWLRVDWVVSQQPTTWQALPAELARHKRNYFRYGIALDTEFKQAFLEQELNANAMLYPQGDTPQAGLNADHFLRYGQARFGKRFQLPQDPQQPLLLFTTEALLFQPEQAPIELHGYSGGSEGRDTGRRKIERLDAPQVENLIAQSSQFLAEQVNNKGRFVYGIHPCFDREINTYNTLRHASTTYAMLEAWEVIQSAELKSAIDRSLTFLTQELIRRYTLPTGEQVAYLQDENNEIKLGGNAVCLLALVKYTELTQDQSHLPLLEQLALGILNLQNPATGQFTHVLNAHDLSVKETFRIIYYDGEAAFGLMRLYGLTQDERWLNTVVKAFDYFIAQKHWQIHDHWLSYCVNELTLYRPEERYFQFGIQNVAGYLDFVIERITTFPTLMELMMAAHKMITRLQTSDDPGCQQNRHLLKTLDLDKFYRALETRAHALLNGFFWPEQAMFFKNPQRILGSFFIRHHSFCVRIDDVEHYVSGYVAYLKYYLPYADAQKRLNLLETIKPSNTQSDLLAPPEAPLPDDLAVLFLNLDLGVRLTGIEHSALSRASLLIQELDCYPIFVTQRYHPYLQQRVKELLASGRYHPSIQVVGLYDLLQGFQMLESQGKNLPPAQEPDFSQYQAETVPGYKDVRYRNQQGQLIAYKVYSKQHGGLTHINYFAEDQSKARKKIAVDIFHAFGYCSSHKALDPVSGQPTHEIYYGSGGQPIFYREFSTPDSLFYLLSADILTELEVDVSVNSPLLGIKRLEKLLPAATFLGHEADLVYLGLERLVAGLPQSKVLLLSDKNKFTLKPALKLRDLYEKDSNDSFRKEIRILGALHSTHYQGATPQTKIKSHYRELLQERPRPVDGLIALTHAQKADLTSRFPSERVTVIPHTIMLDWHAHDMPLPVRDPYKIVYVARLSPEKNHVMAVEIFAQVLKQVPQARLHFYGEGQERESVQLKIEELQLQDKVFLQGYCSDIIPIYQTAACTILTSKMEGLSMSLLEAMAQGCPIVAFDINYGPRDIVVSGETGYLIPYGNQALFAQRLVELLTEPEHAARIQKQAKDRFEHYFSSQNIAVLWRRAFAGIFT